MLFTVDGGVLKNLIFFFSLVSGSVVYKWVNFDIVWFLGQLYIGGLELVFYFSCSTH